MLQFIKKTLGFSAKNLPLKKSPLRSNFKKDFPKLRPMDLLILNAEKNSQNLIFRFQRKDASDEEIGKAILESIIFMLARARFSFSDDVRNFDITLYKTLEQVLDKNYKKQIKINFGGMNNFLASRFSIYNEELRKLSQHSQPTMGITYNMFFQNGLKKGIDKSFLENTPESFYKYLLSEVSNFITNGIDPVKNLMDNK